jgi:hypothetical protein
MIRPRISGASAARRSSAAIGLAFVENSGPDNLRDVLRVELRDARQVCIAVAFVTSDGLDQILQLLVERLSIRSIERMTGTHRDTIPNVLVVAGGCERLFETKITGLAVNDVQSDGI